MHPEALLTVEEVADLLRLHRNSVRRLLRDGKVPAARLGKRWWVRRADLEQLLAGDGRSPTAPAMASEAARRQAAIVVEAALDAIVTTDEAGRILEWNPAAERLFGHARADALGREIVSLIVPERELDERRRDIRRYLAGRADIGVGQQMEMVARRADGTEFPIEFAIVPLRGGAAPGSAQFTGFLRDISARQQAERALRDSEERLRFALGAAGMGAWDWDLTGDTVRWSDGHELLFGIAPGTFEGTFDAFLRRVHPDDQPRVLETLRRAADEATDFDSAYRVAWPDGAVRWLVSRGIFFYDAAGAATRMVGVTTDETERRQTDAALQQSADRQRILASIGEPLSSSLRPQTILRRVAKRVAETMADWCSLFLFGEDGSLQRRATAHSARIPATQFRKLRQRYGLDLADAGWVAALRDLDKPLLLPDLPDELLEQVARDPDHLKLLRAIGPRSLMLAPLRAAGQTLGLMVVGAVSGDPYTPADLALAEEVARRVAVALDTARLYDAGQAARQAAERAAERAARLYAVTAALAGALTPAQVATVIVEQGVAAMGANAGLFVALTDDGTTLQIVGAVGYETSVTAPWQRFPLSADVPIAESTRTGEALWLESRREMEARFPVFERQAVTANQAVACLPLLAEGGATGAIGLSFRAARSFSADERTFMVSLARQASLALERARLYEAEQQARAEAEAAQRHLAFLAEASTLLVASLDVETVLEGLVQRLVPELADWCVLSIAGADGSLRPTTSLHADAAKQAVAEQFLERYMATPRDMDPPLQVLHSGQSLFVPAVTPDAPLPDMADEPQRALLERLAISGWMVVPLTARDQALGTLSLARTDGRHYTAADLSLAEEMGRRAGMAMDNARLYQEAQEAIAARDHFLSIASHELKTPITTIKGFAELLMRRAARDEGASGRDLRSLAIVQEEAGRLHKLIEQLLDVSRVQVGQLSIERQPMELGALAERAVRVMQTSFQQHFLQWLPASGPVAVLGDVVRLEQVLHNLIHNAAKYSPDGGAIVVRLAAEEGWARLSVSDRGIGIPPDEVAQLFDRFYRAANVATHRISGMGLGLYVVHHIVEAHRGTVQVSSTPGIGSTFTVALPLLEG